jgi:hypothetical protein
MTGLVGASTRTRRTNDDTARNGEIQHGIGAFRKHTSDERAHNNARCGDIGRNECTRKGETDRFGKEVHGLEVVLHQVN